jgi:nucleoside transporter
MTDTPEDPAALSALIPEPALETPVAVIADSAALQHDAGAELASVVGIKLAGALFLQHFCVGSWMVTLGSYVAANTGAQGQAIFAAGFVGAAYGAGPLAGMVSPFLSGLLADRYFSAERMTAFLNLMCSIAMFAATGAQSQASFFVALFAFYLFHHPAAALASSMALHHLKRPERDYPAVRACGTAGWVAAGVFVGWIWPRLTGEFIESTVTPMKICAVASLINAAYSLFLPHTPPIHRRAAPTNIEQLGLGPGQLRDLICEPRFIGLMLLAVLAHVPSQFYYAYGNVYFNWTGMSSAAAKMTLGQLVEVGVMLTLPALLVRWSVRAAIAAGLGIWCLRFIVLAISAAPDAAWRDALFYAAILTHGLAFTLVTISLQLDVDRCAGRRLRATAQGLFSVAVQGFGCFAGAQLAGFIGARVLPTDIAAATGADWRQFWLFPAGGAAAALVLSLILLVERRK